MTLGPTKAGGLRIFVFVFLWWGGWGLSCQGTLRTLCRNPTYGPGGTSSPFLVSRFPGSPVWAAPDILSPQSHRSRLTSTSLSSLFMVPRARVKYMVTRASRVVNIPTLGLQGDGPSHKLCHVRYMNILHTNMPIYIK